MEAQCHISGPLRLLRTRWGLISFHLPDPELRTGATTTFALHRMDLHLARSLTAALHDDACIFGYSGHFPDEHSARLIELGEAVHHSHETTHSSKGRLGYVMVEAYQNVVRYRTIPTNEEVRAKGRSMFQLRCHAQGQVLATRNPVTRPQQRILQERLTELQGKDTRELKELFMEGIQRANVPGMRGAGLGLIEMVRRAGAKPGWSFEPLDPSHILFKLILELGDAGAVKTYDPALDEGLQKLVLEHALSTYYAGFWDSEVQHAILGTIRDERMGSTGEKGKRYDMAGRVADLLHALVGTEGNLIVTYQNGVRPVLSIGGELAPEQLDRIHQQMHEPEVVISVGDGFLKGKMLTVVHIPW